MSDSVRPHRWQPTRLPHPWESPGKNTGVGCHFLLQCMKVKSQSEVTQSYPTLSDPMDCNLPGSSVHGIFQARVLKWGAIVFSILTYYKVQINIESCVFKKHIWSSALGLENRPFLCFKMTPWIFQERIRYSVPMDDFSSFCFIFNSQSAQVHNPGTSSV